MHFAVAQILVQQGTSGHASAYSSNSSSHGEQIGDIASNPSVVPAYIDRVPKQRAGEN